MPLRFAALLLWASLTATAWAATLRIEVVRGEGSNNNAATSGIATLAVRVVGDDGPVGDALVAFTAPDEGPTVTFSGSGQVGEGLTDEAGLAVSPRLKPSGGNGPVEIRVMASHGGVIANAVIHQMNLGMGEPAAAQIELNVVRVEGDEGDARSLRFHLRVEDQQGHPVPRARVSVLLRKPGKTDKRSELWRTDATSDEQGEVSCSTARPNGKGPFELVVQAAVEGSHGTRYFPVE